jgi:hypothetical protein
VNELERTRDLDPKSGQALNTLLEQCVVAAVRCTLYPLPECPVAATDEAGPRRPAGEKNTPHTVRAEGLEDAVELAESHSIRVIREPGELGLLPVDHDADQSMSARLHRRGEHDGQPSIARHKPYYF